MYADHEFYTSQFHGDLIPADKFEKYSGKAGAYIDHVTFNRIHGGISSLLMQGIKLAECSCAEKYFLYEKGDNDKNYGVSSEKVGDYSITYKSESRAKKRSVLQKELYETVREYIGHSGLMYRG